MTACLTLRGMMHPPPPLTYVLPLRHVSAACSRSPTLQVPHSSSPQQTPTPTPPFPVYPTPFPSLLHDNDNDSHPLQALHGQGRFDGGILFLPRLSHPPGLLHSILQQLQLRWLHRELPQRHLLRRQGERDGQQPRRPGLHPDGWWPCD